MSGKFLTALLLGLCVSLNGSAANKKIDETEEFVKTLMTEEGITAAFGKQALQNTVEYDQSGKLKDVNLEKILSHKVKFLLYTRENINTSMFDGTEIFEGNKDHLIAYGFNISAPTKIICHGFMSNYAEGPGQLLVPAYLNASTPDKPINIITINWDKIAGAAKVWVPNKPVVVTQPQADRNWFLNLLPNKLYFPPASKTEFVGNKTGSLIKFLVEKVGVDAKNIHLIGHSLGAHAMGHAGRFIQDNMQAKLARITALDPAGPCFERSFFFPFCLGGNYISISENDADFVDAIHTNAGGFGMKRQVGHVDFYPNSGFWQNGCPSRWWSRLQSATCAHRRSIELMRDSILDLDNKFHSMKCDSWDTFKDKSCSRSRSSEEALMGESCLPSNGCPFRGKFFLETNEKPPFAVRWSK